VADLDVGWETVAWQNGFGDRRHIKKDKVGFYGLDVYSLWESFDEVLKYLENKDLTIKRPP
jgi:erythromycin esterase-like protein